MAGTPDQAEYVADDDRTRLPYSGIGYIHGKHTETGKRSSCTAFYVGNKTIITAAHFFDELVTSTALFIPAMRDEYDKCGELYGFYHIQEVHCYPDYVPGQQNARNDICTAKLCNGKKIIEGTKGSPKLGPADVNDLTPLSLREYQAQDSRDWLIIGYDCSNRMMRVRGRQNNVEVRDDDDLVEIAPGVPPGLSGSPWIRMGGSDTPSVVTGFTATVTAFGTQSPHFTTALIDSIIP